MGSGHPEDAARKCGRCNGAKTVTETRRVLVEQARNRSASTWAQCNETITCPACNGTGVR